VKDEQMYKILEDFANSHNMARDIVVSMNGYSTSFKPRFPAESFKHEDSELLSELVRGATHFMMWLRREGKARLVKCPSKEAKKRKINKNASKKGRYRV
jgi:hypothetical protein